MFSVALLTQLLDLTPEQRGSNVYHKAFKKVKHFDSATGKTVEPSEPNGYKFEIFSQSLFANVALEKMGVIEVDR
jgi:hypothetical protein